MLYLFEKSCVDPVAVCKYIGCLILYEFSAMQQWLGIHEKLTCVLLIYDSSISFLIDDKTCKLARTIYYRERI